MGLEFGSVCSGIEAASVAWHHLGWRAAWLAEVDRAASEVLAYRFPDTPNHGDMLGLAEKIRNREIPAPDILVGGTPCQAFSVAGARQGLNDARGQLTLAYVVLANAIDEVRAADGKPPATIVWENVPGVLTSKDNAFGCFLAGLAGESDELKPSGRKWTNAGVVLGPERSVAWRTLDAQYFGLAQRRRRVFVIASAREGFDPAAILFEFDGLRRDSPPSREQGQGLTHSLAPCLTSSGRGVERTGDPRGQDAVVAVDGRLRQPTGGVKWPADIASTLNAHFGSKQGLEDQHVNQGCPLFVPTPLAFVQNSRDEVRLKGGDDGIAGALSAEGGTHQTTYIASIGFSSKDYGQDAGEEVSPTLRAGTHTDSHANGGVAPAVCYAFKPGMSEAAGALLPTVEVSPTLQAGENGSTRTPAVAYAFQPRIARNGRGDMGDLVNALTAQAGETGKGDAAPCVAYAIQERAVCENPLAGPDGMGVRGDDCAYTMEARQVPQAVAYAFKPSHFTRGKDGAPSDVYPPLTADADKGDQDPVIAYMPARTFGADGGIDERFAERDICDALHTSSGNGNKAPLMVEAFRVPGNVVPYSTGDRVDALTSANDSSAQFPILHEMAVRRLMPVECERLQGFPDGWTAVPTGKKGKPAADGPRYKQLGNSMAVNCMAWIGRRIAAHLATLDTANDDDFDSLIGGDDFDALLS